MTGVKKNIGKCFSSWGNEYTEFEAMLIVFICKTLNPSAETLEKDVEGFADMCLIKAKQPSGVQKRINRIFFNVKGLGIIINNNQEIKQRWVESARTPMNPQLCQIKNIIFNLK